MRTWWLAIALVLAASGVQAEAQKTTTKAKAKPAAAADKTPAVPVPATQQDIDADAAILKPGSFSWAPERSPKGPVVLVVSLPEQRMHVYRNGVRIAVTTVSTGIKGRDTPPGSYEILQKQLMHHSNLYDDAPMPFMQRITWDGLALHAGRLPGHPASHGCVRLPRAFAEKLYEVTRVGARVVISEDSGLGDLDNLVHPGPDAPIDAISGLPLPDVAAGVLPAPKQLATRDDGTSGGKKKAKDTATEDAPAVDAAAVTPPPESKPEPLPTPIDDPATKVQKPADDSKNQEIPVAPTPDKPSR
ncbi:L,D-transpeptidase family protein [Solilutibacter silvestris]|uniref:L,D-transpeptidase catalytic domain n=1 Tax=Solilutibacter silvestris TaxID=1645665 RepID=A0A2K1Q183_9GAMM|nr:L,D-transpeptidase family protein [Lysobacter silvestris]PNS08805.1 L,D-transpeptidase catalytic domain [Lysobacter silvestris]